MKTALDFSILDGKQTAITPTDAPKQDGQYKTTPTTSNAPQTNTGASQGIQQYKQDIAKGVKAGADPYPLLLTAIQAIAAVTNDRAFYTVCRDVMQGAGMMERLPPEWEREATETSLLKLEAARQNIDNAITAHKQYLDGQPISANGNVEDEYNRRIKRCFGAAYKFLEEHKYARTSEDWERIVADVALYTDLLTVDLVVAAVSELEREYKTAEGLEK